MLRDRIEILKIVYRHPEARRVLWGQIGRVLAYGIASILSLTPLKPLLWLALEMRNGALPTFLVGAIACSLLCVASMSMCAISLETGLWMAVKALPTNRQIETDHGKTVTEVITRLHRLPMLCYAFFDDNESKVNEITLYSLYDWPALDSLLPEERGFGGTLIRNCFTNDFPLEDFCEAVRHGLSEYILVTDKMVYDLKIPEQALAEIDPEELEDCLLEAYCSLDAGPWSTAFYTNAEVVWYGACQAIALRFGLDLTVEKFSKRSDIKNYRKERWQSLLGTFFGIYANPSESEEAHKS